MRCVVVTPEKAVYEGEDVTGVFARSPEGEFGIMRGHIPFLAALVPGRVRVVSGSHSKSSSSPAATLIECVCGAQTKVRRTIPAHPETAEYMS